MPPRSSKPPVPVCGTKCFGCATRNTSEWSALVATDLVSLDEHKICADYPAGRAIFTQGATCRGIFCVSLGVIALRKSDARGKSVLVRLVTAGETLGYRSFFAGGDYSCTAETMTPARVCFVDKEAVNAIIQRNPVAATAFLQRMAFDLLDAEETQLNQVTMSTRGRFASLLLRLRDEFGVTADDGTITMRIPLSRQDTAAMLGTRPETLARLIRKFEDEGVARFDGRSIVIPDVDALLDEMGA